MSDEKVLDTLNYSFKLDDIDAYIITVKGNEHSEQLSDRCQQSCRAVGQPYHVWDAFNGMTDQITYPDHAKDQGHYKWLKQMNDRLTIGEVAAILSHYSLWAKCVELDRPIVILEHDAIMVKPYKYHNMYNTINYLGCQEQMQMGKYPTFPPYAKANKNYHFICRAHAYAIDPAVARQLIAYVIRHGLAAPADMLIRIDLFSIVQDGFYAFDSPQGTTILGRKDNWEEDAKEIFSTFA